MSFDNFDLEHRSGGSGGMPPKNTSSNAHNPDDFEGFKNSISLQIFKVNSNVQGINRLIDKLGTAHDGAGLRKSLANLTESTRRMIERSGKDIQDWAALVPEMTSETDRSTQQRVAKEFSAAILAFQRSQKLSAEKLKQQIAREQKHLAGEMEDQRHSSDDLNLGLQSSPQNQVQLTQQRSLGSSSGATAFQESLIAEREVEIREIETGIHELNDIFHDLNKLVGEQGDMIDNIESNVTNVEADTRLAGTELTAAHEYQRKAGRRMVCLMLLLVVVVTVVLLAVLS